MAVQIGEFEVVPAPQGPAAGAGGQGQGGAEAGGGEAPPQPGQSAAELRKLLDRMRSRARRVQAD